MESNIDLVKGPKLYQYSSINEKLGEIRLLTLLPGKSSDEIRATLEIVSFPADGANSVEFEALSYTWGSIENMPNILIGEIGSETLPVTQNLATALSYLRHKNQPRVLWIDAICVNQQDKLERSSQVKRMADIYTNATQVVVWLGPESLDSMESIDTIALICSHVTVDWTANVLQSKSTEQEWSSLETPLPFSESQFLALLNLFSRSWFERQWIWQEVRLAPQSTIVMCGTMSISWGALCNAVFCLSRKPIPEYALHETLKKRINAVVQLCDMHSRTPFINLIDQTKYSLCTDSRDRIFALLSMLPRPERGIGITPDYTKNVSEVYQDAAVRYIKYCKDLEILASVELNESRQDMPSWVPDWSVPQSSDRLGYVVIASSTSVASEVHNNGGVLHITGIQVAKLGWVEPFTLAPLGSTSKSEIIYDLRRVDSKIATERPVSKRHGYITALCRTICADHFSERHYLTSNNQPSLRLSEDTLRHILELEFVSVEGSVSFHDRLFFSAIAYHCCGRSIFITEEGGLGIGPKWMKPGDIAAVFLGLRSAMILRPVENGRYKLLGEAYCHGYMDGEALLGSLPGVYQVIKRRHESTGRHSWAYLHRETGNIVPEDPRLGELPVAWTKKSHPLEEFWPGYVHIESEDEMTDNDPRLTTEALRARGVELQVFNLV